MAENITGTNNTDTDNNFFSVATKTQTYLNLVYLLLAFPLGIFYFVFLVTGLSLGAGLAITLVGVPILTAVLAASYGFVRFEREMAARLLNIEIANAPKTEASEGFLNKLKVLLTDPVTWQSVLYLLGRFPLGILSFIMVVTLGSISLSFIAAPLYYNLVDSGIYMGINNSWVIDTLSEAFVLSILGFIIGIVSLHVLNGLAWVSGQFARVMLGSRKVSETAPAPAPVAEKIVEDVPVVEAV